MKCPWRIKKHIEKDGMGHVYSDTKFDECYTNECPFYACVTDGTSCEIVYEGCERKDRS